MEQVSTENDECSLATDALNYFAENGMVKIDQRDIDYNLTRESFLSGLKLLATDTSIVAIHKNAASTFTAKARLNSFNNFADAVKKNRGGDANIRLAWYGAPREKVNAIVCHGFSQANYGIILSAVNSSIDGLVYAKIDEKGLRHMLLCRVILGKTEAVPRQSMHSRPSLKIFDSGVDNLVAPSKYVVWSCYMNSHIFVDYIVSFRISCVESFRKRGIEINPISREDKFHILRAILSRYLDPSRMALIAKDFNDYKNGKITVRQFYDNLKRVADPVTKLVQVTLCLLMEEKHWENKYAGAGSSGVK